MCERSHPPHPLPSPPAVHLYARVLASLRSDWTASPPFWTVSFTRLVCRVTRARASGWVSENENKKKEEEEKKGGTHARGGEITVFVRSRFRDIYAAAGRSRGTASCVDVGSASRHVASVGDRSSQRRHSGLFVNADRLNWIPKRGGSNKWSLAWRGRHFCPITSHGRAQGARQRPGFHRGREHVAVAEPPLPCHDSAPPGGPAGAQNHELFHRQHPPTGLRLQEGAGLPQPDGGQRERQPAGGEAARRQPLPGLELQQRQHLVVARLVVVLVAVVQAELGEAGRGGGRRDWQICGQPVFYYGCERQQRSVSADNEGEPAAAVARLGLLHSVLGPAVIW